jgi:uncharacterized DUF497 family protein
MDDKQKQLILSVARVVDAPYANLYFEPDMENGGVGIVTYKNCVWDKGKSNLNLQENGFSFYLARTAFLDKCFTMVGLGFNSGGEYFAGSLMGSSKMPILVIVDVVFDSEGDLCRIQSSWENKSSNAESQYLFRRKFVSEACLTPSDFDRELLRRSREYDDRKNGVFPGSEIFKWGL